MNIFKFARGAVPKPEWGFYAALRLGTGIICYFTMIAIAALGMSFMGFVPTIMVFFGLAPILIFFAIRLSGTMTERWRPKKDY
jgi:hypothetical protein